MIQYSLYENNKHVKKMYTKSKKLCTEHLMTFAMALDGNASADAGTIVNVYEMLCSMRGSQMKTEHPPQSDSGICFIQK